MSGKVKVFSSVGVAANGNALATLTPSSCIVHEELNGDYSLSLTHPVDEAGRWRYLNADNILQAPTPDGDQFFRIAHAQKNMLGEIQVQASHIFYDLLDNFIEDIYPTQVDGDTALQMIKANLQFTAPFTFTSNISLIHNARWIRKNPVELLIGDDENSFVNRWGGEIRRDNYSVAVNKRIGSDRGFAVKYRRNMTGLTCTEDHTQIYTRIYPTALSDDDTVTSLPEKYIDSGNISSYPHPKVTHLHFDDIRLGQVGEDGTVPYPDTDSVYVALRERVADLYASGVDKPVITIEAEFFDLSITDEYKKFAFASTVKMGDTIYVQHENLGIDYKLRMIAYDYDSLRGRYNGITMGAKPFDLAQSVNDTDVDISALKNNVSNALRKGQKYNHVYITHAEGFVAETADGKCRTTQDGEGFTAVQMISGKEARTVISSGVPLSVYYDGKLIGGAVIQGDQLVYTAGRLTTPDASSCYGTVGKWEQNGITRYGFFMFDNSASPFLRMVKASTGNAWIYSDKGLQLGNVSVILIDVSGNIEIEANGADLALKGKTLSLSEMMTIKPTTDTTGFNGPVSVGSTTLTFNKGILTKVETGG